MEDGGGTEKGRAQIYKGKTVLGISNKQTEEVVVRTRQDSGLEKGRRGEAGDEE